MARFRQSRRDLGNLDRPDVENLGAISNIMARSLQSRRDFANLGKMYEISPQSRRDSETQISWRDLSRDLCNLADVFRQDHGKKFALYIVMWHGGHVPKLMRYVNIAKLAV